MFSIANMVIARTKINRPQHFSLIAATQYAPTANNRQPSRAGLYHSIAFNPHSSSVSRTTNIPTIITGEINQYNFFSVSGFKRLMFISCCFNYMRVSCNFYTPYKHLWPRKLHKLLQELVPLG